MKKQSKFLSLTSALALTMAIGSTLVAKGATLNTCTNMNLNCNNINLNGNMCTVYTGCNINELNSILNNLKINGNCVSNVWTNCTKVTNTCQVAPSKVNTTCAGTTNCKTGIKTPVAQPNVTPASTKPVVKPQVTTPTPSSTPKPTTTKPVNTTMTETRKFQLEVLNLVNQERTKAGLSTLKENLELSKVATIKSEDMAKNNYFSHTSPTYGSPFDMMNKFGIKYMAAGENIAMGQATPAEVMKGWMNSPGHRANILNGSFTEIGIGIAKNSSGSIYWTQQFIGK